MSIEDSLRKEIDHMAQSAFSITLIPDGWKQPNNNTEFLGLAGIMMTESFDKEFVLFGFEEMDHGHTAERVKETIELIINDYSYDKQKIRGT